jgi:DNA helicase-2/ATP-dependent DNA helicase PcrA
MTQSQPVAESRATRVSAIVEHVFGTAAPLQDDPVDSLLAGLNDAQRTAVTHDGGPLRVLAGPGTGKTTTLTHRVAWLVAGGVPAERLLLLTFTRRAARQMVQRSDALLAAAARRTGSRYGRVRGGTFHSVAHRTLRRHAARLGLPDGFGVLDTADAADVVDLVRHDLGLSSSTAHRFPRKAALLDVYSRVVNSQRPLADVIAEVVPWAGDRVGDVAAVCRGYVERKRGLGVLDFDDLLLHWLAATQDPRIAATEAGAVDHVLVDEYQDVNTLQVEILRALRRQDDRLTVVGDDAQAIYGFRAADPRHILEFAEAFPGSRTVVLETSYRTGQRLLDVANAVAAQAPEGFSAVLRSAPDAPAAVARPTVWRCHDEDAQCVAVCERVLALREEGILLREQAVLVRAAHASNALELELSARRIPYVKFGGLRFLESAHVKDLLAAFRLADNPRDELAWFRVLQLLPGVGPASARRAVTALGASGAAENEATNNTALGAAGSSSDGEVLLRWPLAAAVLPAGARPVADAVAEALAPLPGESVAAHAERLRAAMVPVIRGAYPDAASRLVDLDAVVAAAVAAERLSDVAAEHALEPPASTSDLAGPPLVDEDWLVISTAHSAKGLEWEAVHVLNASDGCWPSDMNLSTKSGLEEERRVFYVALTRARRALNLYLPQRYHHVPRGRDDAHSWSQPSRFLGEGALRMLDIRDSQAVDPAGHGWAGVPEGSPAANAADLVAARLDTLWG